MFGLGYLSEKERYKRSQRRMRSEYEQEKRYQARLREARMRNKIRKDKAELFKLEHPHLSAFGESAKHSATGFAHKQFMKARKRPGKKRRRRLVRRSIYTWS